MMCCVVWAYNHHLSSLRYGLHCVIKNEPITDKNLQVEFEVNKVM